MESSLLKKLKPYILVIFLQFCIAGFGIIAKFALNKGTSHYTLVVYRNIIASLLFAPFAFVLERKIRPKMTLIVFFKIMLIAFLDSVLGQNLCYVGLKYTSATFNAAMFNLLPALTFLLAWILRIEKVNFKKLGSHAKIWGTCVTIGGAMIMTLIKGSIIRLPWMHDTSNDTSANSSSNNQQYDPIKGALMLGVSCLSYSMFYIIQANTLKTYPAGLSVTTLICTFGAVLATAMTFIAERGNIAVWALGWNEKLFAYVYGGIVASGIFFYVSGVIMKEKGPVFVTAFSPLSMVIVAIMSSFILAEQLDVGKVTGAVVIVIGLCIVTWGKSKDPKEGDQEHDKHKGSETNILPSKALIIENVNGQQKMSRSLNVV